MPIEEKYLARFDQLKKEAGTDKLALLLISAIQLQTEVLQEHAEHRQRSLKDILATIPFDK